MKIIQAVAVGLLTLAVVNHPAEAAGKKETVAGTSVDQASRVHAVTRQFSIEGGELKIEENTYVDGVAIRLDDGAGAVLTRTPMSACDKLAVAAIGSLDFNASVFGDKPALVLVRNAEHPQGAILRTEPYVTSTLEESFPGLVTDGDTLKGSGDVGDAGWGSIDPTQYGAEKSPHVRLDVKLPYSTIDSADPIAADASPEAKWLRDTQAKAVGDAQGVVDGSIEINPEDYSGSLASSTWFDVLANWANLNVVAVATDKDCATLVLREPGFVGGYKEAILQTRMIGGVRKVVAAQSEDVNEIEGDYAFGRVEHGKLGGFPVLHARAFREAGVGLVVLFSDKPIGTEPFESLIVKQRVLRAVASVESGDQYGFSSYELGGPRVPVEQIAAGNTLANPELDDEHIAGLIKFGEGEVPRITVNFRQTLE